VLLLTVLLFEIVLVIVVVVGSLFVILLGINLRINPIK
jgi:hypothetical protein